MCSSTLLMNVLLGTCHVSQWVTLCVNAIEGQLGVDWQLDEAAGSLSHDHVSKNENHVCPGMDGYVRKVM